jgi:hypothetical protein
MTHSSERAQFVYKTADQLGIRFHDAYTILRKAQTLHTWAVHECNGTIQRDETDGKCYWYSDRTCERIGRTSDRETGAIKALDSICRPLGIHVEYQGDPRGYVVKLHKDGREYGVPSRG